VLGPGVTAVVNEDLSSGLPCLLLIMRAAELIKAVTPSTMGSSGNGAVTESGLSLRACNSGGSSSGGTSKAAWKVKLTLARMGGRELLPYCDPH
jgi:hypothetical protein